MEPKLKTDPKLLPILKELKAREPIGHHPEFGTERSDYENMTDPSFWEVGASGRRYSREYLISTLVERYKGDFEDEWSVEDFYLLEIAEDSYLLTYTLTQGSRITRRSTIWRKSGDDWKILYHQGTIVEG